MVKQSASSRFFTVRACHRVLWVCMALTVFNQLEWLRFSPILDQTMAQYHVDASDVGDLSALFSGVFILVGLPAGVLIDKASTRGVLRAASTLMFIGTTLHCVAPDFLWLIVGTCILAISQPLILGVLGKLVAVWFGPSERPLATSLGSMSIFAGIGLAYVLVPLTIGASIYHTLFVDLVVSLVLVGAAFVWVPRDPRPLARARLRLQRQPLRPDGARIWRRPLFVVLMSIIFLSNGYFNALFTWLTPILGVRGFHTKVAGLAALTALIGGVLGIIGIPFVIGRFRLDVTVFIPISIGLATVFSVLVFATHDLILLLALMFALGASVLSPLPALIELVVQVVGVARAGMGLSVFWLVGAAGATLLTAAIGRLADNSAWSYASGGLVTALLVELALASVFLRRFKGNPA